MLLHTDGGKLLVLRAWPSEWVVDFRLHGRAVTTIEKPLEMAR